MLKERKEYKKSVLVCQTEISKNCLFTNVLKECIRKKKKQSTVPCILLTLSTTKVVLLLYSQAYSVLETEKEKQKTEKLCSRFSSSLLFTEKSKKISIHKLL